MNAHKLERIGMRRIELRKEYSHEYGLSFEEWIIQKLVSAEERISQLESYVSAMAELSPNTNAVLYTERERFEYVEQFRAMGKEAKKLLPSAYVNLEDKEQS